MNFLTLQRVVRNLFTYLLLKNKKLVNFKLIENDMQA